MSQTETKDVSATTTRKPVVYPEAFRRESVAAWRRSGLSVPKYAPQMGVHETTLYAWIRADERPHGAARKRQSISIRGKLKTVACALKTRTYAPNATSQKNLGILSEPAQSATKG